MDPAPVTAVIPLHNKAAHIQRTIHSILSQEQKLAQVIVVDDASSDGGADLVRAAHLPNLKLFSRNTPGPGGYAARNLGVQEAVTEWVTFLDADDTWQPNYVRVVTDLIGRATRDVGCVFTGFVHKFASTSHVNGYAAARTDVHALGFDEFLDGWIASEDCPIWTGAAAFRRSVLLEAGLFPDGRCRRGGDKDLWLRVISRTTALCDPRPLAIYHRDADNMVTRTVNMARRPCICDTLVDLIGIAEGDRAKRLKRLFNLEARAYAFQCLRTGQLPPEVMRGYYRSEDFARWLFYRAVSLIPQAPLGRLVEAQRHLKNSGRRLVGRWFRSMPLSDHR
jgi:glycosyltransferase involved in cell wall biosynthesis